MITKDGNEFVSDMDEDDYGLEGGEDEIDEEQEIAMLEAQLSDKQKKKLADAGVTIQDYLAGNGPDLTDEDGDYGDEEGEEDVDGDANDDDANEENGDEEAAGEKKPRVE